MKRVLSFVVALSLVCLAIPFSVFAEQGGDMDSVIYVCSWENPSREGIPGAADNSTFRYGEEVIPEIISSESATIVTTPSGQPVEGYSFPSAGGSVDIDLGGGPTVTYSVGVSWGVVSVGISIGAATTSSVSGISVDVPGDGNHYKIQLRHNYIINRVKHDHYQYGEYLYTTYTNEAVLQTIDAFLIKT